MDGGTQPGQVPGDPVGNYNRVTFGPVTAQRVRVLLTHQGARRRRGTRLPPQQRGALTDRGTTPPPVVHTDWSPATGYAAGATLARDPDVTATVRQDFSAVAGLASGLLGRRQPRSSPGPRLSGMGELVALRPLVERDLDLLERLHGDPGEAGEFGFFGHRNPGVLRRQWAEVGFLTDKGGRLAVVGEDDRFVGEVQWREVFQGPASPCWNIGVGLLAAERGHGHGTRAQRLLVDYLFDHTKANRVEASTERANVAERRALEKAGFTREGVLRGACFRAGAWRDMVLYAVLRSDITEAAPVARPAD
ncbi:GNAT family N-acetyltransferase [Actinokineospora guangxiensis]|uniref:GNAT family N-acetyltransferase n=1 Tax=Actinokineospora guangxiensis TaxID=1490288 RepID=UPI00366B51AF